MPASCVETDRIVRNSAFNLIGQGVYAIFHLLSIVVLARALGVEGFGEYYTIFAVILVVQLLTEAGLGTTVTCRLIRNPAERRRIMSEGAGLFAVVCAASAIVLMAIGV